MFIIAVMYALIGLLFIGLSIPMIRHRVKRNPWYGFRTPKTLSSDRVWYAANEHSGRMLFLSGLVTIISTLLLMPFAALSADVYAAACLFVMLGTLVYTTYLSFMYLRRL